MSKMLPNLLRISLLAGFTVIAVSNAAFASPGHGSPFGEPAKASQATRTVTITMRDNLFAPESLTVKPGEIIRFVLVNKGELLHEFNIGTPAMQADHQDEMARMMENGMLTPMGMNQDMSTMDHSKMSGMKMEDMKHDDPNSILVEPGKKGQLTWRFTKPTKLEFACNIPGHYEAGMVGPIKFAK
ncbi:MAG: cupredoxin family protein [Alphaproteobacteria bacterium]|nr:cupredoxin family protein [Alphaproteobacteria bacterium]